MNQRTAYLDLTIAEMLNRWPEVIPVFLNYKLSCVGCTMAVFETLSDAVEIYHLPRTQFLYDVVMAMRSKPAE